MTKQLQLLCALALVSMLTACAPQAAPQEPAKDAAPPAATQMPQAAETPPAPEAPPAPPPAPDSPADFVRVQAYIPDIVVDLRYYTADNFTGKVIYDYSEAYLRYGTVEKLAKVQQALAEQGYRLKIWDAFRTAAAQDALWQAYPDGNFVANPANGYSGHVRGNTVDLTLVTLDGEAVEMPSAFDDFSARADRDYSDATETAAQHARLLEKAMEQGGFTGYKKEWWHYTDTTRYEPELAFKPEPQKDTATKP